MARITITIPDEIHKQVLKTAKKNNDSVSYTISKLVDIGLTVINNKKEPKQVELTSELDDHCKKLIIQMNGIIKEIATDHYRFTPEKINKIAQDTISKFNELSH